MDRRKAKRRIAQILEQLRARYPTVKVPLHHRNPLELLVATILSAQCTDATVNRITPALFARYRTARDYAFASPAELEALIRPTGFYRQKARAIINACRALMERFEGEVPRTMEELLTLDGVGRKTANVILSSARLEGWTGWDPSAEDGLGIVVDTHVRRVARRLGLTQNANPEKIERDLMALIPREEWPSFPLRLIYLGRELCRARNPLCHLCPLQTLCPSAPRRGASL
ncbi:MAG: endonuclease III [Armatimonadota bacterium]|nr:endonuclease III [Armatimonadota bacterium]MDR5702971.1 endonuclease III [Armatimonadota bacterium]MDR7435787.1 endonuclease III [Armatimonadota bacterium]